MYLASNPYLPKYKLRASVILSDGEAFEGHLFAAGDQRISDLLKTANPFLAFAGLDGGFHLFHRRAIASVVAKEREMDSLQPSEGAQRWTMPASACFAEPADEAAAAHPSPAGPGEGVRPQWSQRRPAALPSAARAPSSAAASREGAHDRWRFAISRSIVALGRVRGWDRRRDRRRRRDGVPGPFPHHCIHGAFLLWAVLLAILAGQMFFSAAPSPEQRLADYSRAMQAYARGDYAAAVPEFEELAAQGLVQAQFRLGVMFSQGEGVPRDYAEAMAWHRQAAENGHAQAQTAIGFMYRNGLGVRQDYGLAYLWFGLGAANGDAGAAARREEVGYRMSYEQVAEAERRIQNWLSRRGG